MSPNPNQLAMTGVCGRTGGRAGGRTGGYAAQQRRENQDCVGKKAAIAIKNGPPNGRNGAYFARKNAPGGGRAAPSEKAHLGETGSPSLSVCQSVLSSSLSSSSSALSSSSSLPWWVSRAVLGVAVGLGAGGVVVGPLPPLGSSGFPSCLPLAVLLSCLLGVFFC